MPPDGSHGEMWESWHQADVHGLLIVVILFPFEEEKQKERVLSFLVTEPKLFVENVFDATSHLNGNV